MIKNVFFDLDDTILDFHKAERIALSKMLKEFKVPVSEEILNRYNTINRETWQKLELKLLTRSEVKIVRYERLFHEFNIDLSPVDAARVYENNLKIGHYFIEGAVELLERLKGKYRLFIVSNGNETVQNPRIESAAIAPYFEKIFISSKVGYDKPAKEFFDACLDMAGDIDKNETVIIGDSLSSDMKGGINAGIHTIWFNPGGNAASDIVPEYQIRSLLEIEALLKKI